MNNQSAINAVTLSESSREVAWERALRYFLYATAACVAYLALNIAVASKGTVPGYDALSYLNAALRINLGFTSGQWASLLDVATDGQRVGLPFTNTLDVLLLALLYNLVDYHIGVWLIHTAYFVLFLFLLRRVFDPTTTALIFLWSIAATQFLHQYTQFISEMKVGMFLILFTAYLFHEEMKSRSWTLFFVTILFLLLRAVNLLFVFPLVVAYAAMGWRRGQSPKQILTSLRPVGLALLVLLPLLIHEMRSLVPYLYMASYSDMAQNWKDMGGITGKWSLFTFYRTSLLQYQHDLVIAALAALAAGMGLSLTPIAARLAPFRSYFVAGLVVLAVLMQAQSTNLMVAYWLYMVLGLAAIAVVAALFSPALRGVLACVLIAMAINVNYASFVLAIRSIGLQKPVTQLATGLVQSMAGLANPVVFQNYAGVGQLDFQGLEVAAGRTLGWRRVDNISYNKGLADYLAVLQLADVALVANRNFMWPSYVGVNHKTEAIAKTVAARATELGLSKSARLYFDSGTDNYIDVYVRPTLAVKLKYERFDDYWLDLETALVIGGPEKTHALAGYVMELDLMVPGVDDPAFVLPLTAKLIAPDGRVAGTTVITRAGTTKVVFPLDGLLPGIYRLVFDKTFSTKADPRKLSAMFVAAALKHVTPAGRNEGKPE